MPELRPTLNKIPAFDATKGAIISFSWNGPQSQKNRIVIREYDTNKTVYDCTQTTMATKHTLHILGSEESNISQAVAYNLSNGKRYIAIVYVYDRFGNQSLPSKEVGFYCFETPVFRFINFTNIDENNIAKVTVNSVYLNVEYKQSNNEVINEYKFTLYDYLGNKLKESKTFYGSIANDTLQWTLGGVTETEKKENGELNYGCAYKIVCNATTVHGMELSVEQKFVVQKNTNGVGALITLKNLPDNTVSISSHFKIVNAEINGEEIYIYDADGNPFAIKLAPGTTLLYHEGFVMQDPWEFTIIGKNFNPNSVIAIGQNNQGDNFKISYCERRYSLVEKAYFLFETKKQTTNFILRSDYMPITDNWYVIYLKYKDGYYTFKIFDPKDLGWEINE